MTSTQNKTDSMKQDATDNKQKDGNTFAGLLRVLKYLWEYYKIPVIIVAICIVLSSSSIIIISMFIQQIVDSYIVPMYEEMQATGTVDYSPLAMKILELCVIAVVGIVTSFAYSRIMIYVSNGTLLRLRKSLFNNMEDLPIKYFDTTQHGDIMSVYTNDIDTLRQMISQSLPSFFNSFISIVVSLIAMIVLNVPLTLVCVVMACVMVFVTINLGKKSSGHFKKQQECLGEVNGFVEEMMNGQKVVKCFCHEEQNVEDFAAINEKLRVSAKKANSIGNIIMPINGNLGNINYVLVAFIGGIIALSGSDLISVGTLIAFLTMSKGFTQPIAQLSTQIPSIVMAGAGATRIFNLYDSKPEEDAGKTKIDNKDTIEEITFTDVNFGYEPDKQILHDISLYAKAGQKLAFVGSTGAGKTTIINLINRFYDVDSGVIKYDNVPIEEIDKHSLRSKVGIVLQDTHLFSTSIMENIRYGRLDATDEECIEAAKAAHAHEFIKQTSNSYQTVLKDDGSNLSQGQRQLVAIARAVIANQPILILDEATSSIDTHTELAVQAGMDELMKNRTSFVIAHRLSTIQDADCIMVMEDGRIIERGNHEELLAQKGRYYHLYTGK